ncbi:hypothetical protein AA313_de0204137 [Arthrobotrys entomopaga]|nr:hypothetical protein AA313_de0204137 [Arthrobotrys entomopaga]
MARKNIESLPYDIFLHILSLIDDKTDLDNLCLALPDSASNIVSKHPTLLDKLYRTEIRDHFLLPVALINFRFNRSHESAAVLEKLDPLGLASPYHSQQAINGNGYNNDNSDSDSDTDEDDIDSLGGGYIYDDEDREEEEEEEEEDGDRQVNMMVMQSISEQTATQMKYIHIRIERLAQIFMKYQLDSHTEGTGRKSRPPTADERRRVIKAVYNAYLVVITRLFAMQGPLADGDSGLPGVDRKLYINLTTSWEFWETKEVGTVMEVLWKEIPTKVIDLASENGFSIAGQKWVIKGENRRYYVNSQMDLIDFAFTGSNWNLDKHIQLLECHMYDDEKGAKEFLTTLVTTDEDSKQVFTPSISSVVATRTNLVLKCQERIRSVIQTAWNKENLVHQNQDRFCTPPARRLVSGRNGMLEVIKHEERSSLRETNWTTLERVMIRDCVWDDWRLEGWGYYFPEFVHPPRRRRMGALGMDDDQSYVPRYMQRWT